MLGDLYEDLVKVRVLMDENPTKAKQELTNINKGLLKFLIDHKEE